jgi:DNA-binding IclR family transcriptional regulator
VDKLRINKSAARAMDVLILFSKSTSPLTLNEICKELDLPKSSGFELVHTLLHKGFLEVDDSRLKTYRLGLMAFETGISYLSNTEIPQQARPLLQELNKQSGGTAFLGIEDRGKIVYLDKAENYSTMRATAKLGARKLMHSTSLGKALLAALPTDKVQYILGNGELEKRTPYTKATIQEIMQDLVKIRERGYSIDDREDHLEMFCIAAPVYDRWNQVVAAISVASLYSNMTQERQENVAQLVVDTAMKLSRRLGYTSAKLYLLKD